MARLEAAKRAGQADVAAALRRVGKGPVRQLLQHLHIQAVTLQACPSVVQRLGVVALSHCTRWSHECGNGGTFEECTDSSLAERRHLQTLKRTSVLCAALQQSTVRSCNAAHAGV